MTNKVNLDAVSIEYDLLSYVTPPQESLLCPVCKNVLLDPLQTPCCHLICTTCLEKSLAEKLECPVDRTRLPRGLSECSAPPRWLNQIIDELVINCPYSGCHRIFPRSSLQWHLRSECPRQPVPCPSASCQLTVLRCHYRDAICEHVTNTCAHCDITLMAKDMPLHLDDCSELSHQCKYCYAEFAVEDLRNHICDLEVITCEASELGCQYQGSRLNVRGHEQSCILRTLKPFLDTHQTKLLNLELENRSLRNAVRRLERHESSEPTIEISSDYLNDRTYLFQALETLSNGLEDLSKSLATLDTKQTHIAMHESARTNEELASIRSGLQGLRIQWHHFVQNQNARGNSTSTTQERSQLLRQGSDSSRVKL